MNYFVSIESKSYFLWQIELLIQSFKFHKSEDKLIIGIAENNSPSIKEFSNNIVKHPNKFFHNNYGKQKGCYQLNKFYALITAIKNGLIEQPFTLIHPDMIMQNPINKPISENFTMNTSPEEPTIKNRIEEQIKQILEKRLFKSENNWFTFGDVIIFNDVPEIFFYRVLEHMEILFNKYGANWNIQKAALMLSFYEVYGNLTLKIDQDLEVNLLQENENANFIHYKYGLPPDFSKLHYKYENEYGLFAAGDGPYKSLLKHNPNITTNYLQKIINTLNIM